jgi:hypothetical protein
MGMKNGNSVSLEPTTAREAPARLRSPAAGAILLATLLDGRRDPLRPASFLCSLPNASMVKAA